MAKNTTPKKITKLDRKKGLYLRDTATKGRGLFCISNIATGEELEVTPAIILNEQANKHTDKTIVFDYAFTFGALSKRLRKQNKVKNIKMASSIVMGIASYCNHDEHPNAEVVWEEKAGTLYYVLRATRPIPKNIEICTSYGDTWFDERK